MIEVIKYGCNPVPILDENKTYDGTNIIIDNTFLDKTGIYLKTGNFNIYNAKYIDANRNINKTVFFIVPPYL